MKRPGAPPDVRVFSAAYWPAPWEMPTLGDGVRGMVEDDGANLWVGWIHADPQGAGHGGTFLDALPDGRRVVVLSVISSRLEGMLTRRGYHYEPEVFVHEGESIDAYVRPAVGS